MANDINRSLSVFDDLFNSVMNWDKKYSRIPPVDIEEGKDSYVIKAELPGFSEDNVKIFIEKHILHISGSVDEKAEEGAEKKMIVKERRMASFSRTFSLPEGLDESAISAEFENGILTVTLPKKEEQVHQIEVKIAKK